MADEAPTPCRWCDEAHGPRCPWVKALEFSSGDERITRVEFFTAADFKADRIEEPPGASYPRLKPMPGEA